MEKMLNAIEKRKLLSRFMNVSVMMVIAIHYLILAADWMQCNLFHMSQSGEIVTDLMKLFGSVGLIVMTGKIYLKNK